MVEPRRAACLLLVAAVVIFVAEAQGQRSGRRGRWGGTVGGNESLFSVPRSQDDIHEWRQARANIQNGDFAAAVERLHQLLWRGRRGVVPIDQKRYRGLRTAVMETLSGMPPDGQQAYEKLTRREAGALLRTAFKSRNAEELEALAWNFPTSSAGRRARLLLGDQALEAGRGRDALAHYSELLFAMSPKDAARRVVMQRMDAARALVQPHGRTQPQAPGQTATGVADEVRALAAHDSSTISWPCYGGGGGGTRPMQPPLSRLQARSQLQLPLTGDGMDPYAMHAVGGLAGIYLNTGHKVLALDPITRRQIWVFPGPYLGGESYSINPKSALVAAVSENVVVAALQVPNAGHARIYRNAIELLYKIPARRLFALDRASGKLLWSHWDRAGGPATKRFHGHDAAGPPLVDGDTLYAATQDRTGAIAYYLSAYDLKTGQVRWRNLICSSQGEVNMFGNARTEFAGGPLAIQDGVVYGTTNLGISYAADARTGRLRWATPYPIIPLPRAQLTQQRSRPVVFANNPVIVAGGVMVCTPLDSEYALGFDTVSGKLLWRMHYMAQAAGKQNRVRWLLGVLGDEVIFSGNGVVGVMLHAGANGQAITPRLIRDPAYLRHGDPNRPARGAIAGGYIYYPSTADIRVFDRKGNAAPQNPIPVVAAGNLLLADGILISTRNNAVTAHCNLDALLHDAERRIHKEPDQPAHYLHLATLLRSTAGISLSGARGARAIRMLKRGLVAAGDRGLGKQSPVYRRLSAELFQISLERAKGLKGHAPDQALTILRRARDQATEPLQWLQAQEQILALSAKSPATYVAELDRMAQAHGDASYNFPQVGTISVRAFALWQSIPHLRTPALAARRCQELLERYGTVDLGGEPAREFGVRTLTELLQRHGRRIYAAIEKRAGQALAAAGGDLPALRRLELRFPHSRAAQAAMNQRLDMAVKQGDLASVAQIFSRRLRAGEPDAGMLRRLMVVAQQAANGPLSRSVAQRILEQHATTTSDYGPDGGRPLGEVVRVPATPPRRQPASLELPRQQLGVPIGGLRGEGTEIVPVIPQPGFEEPKQIPLYTLQDMDTLQAYDLRVPATWDQPLFPSGVRHRIEGKLLLCGTTLLLPDLTALHALHYRTGEQRWSFDTQGYRRLTVLGVQQGVLHVFSHLVGRGDGGELMGFEPVTGTMLFRHQTDSLTGTTRAPKAFLGDLWMVADGDRKIRPHILRLDGLTGRVKAKVPLPASLLQRLRSGKRKVSGHMLDQLHLGMLVDQSALYLSLRHPARGRTPLVAAVKHQGGQRWLWTGDRDGQLVRCGLHRAGIILVQVKAPSNSKFFVLGRANGAEKRIRSMSSMVTVPNWEPNQDQAPDQVLLAQDKRGLTLTCMSLTKDVPSFHCGLSLRNHELQPGPVFGDTFLAVPVVSRQRDRRELLVLDLKTRRRIPLARGRRTLRLADARTGFRLTRHGKYIVYQAETSVYVLGKGTDSK